MPTPFHSQKRFEDKKHFPYGLARSGIFSKKQVALLEQHGYAYQRLACGDLLPEGAEETAFVDFCQGRKAAISDHEKVWALYQSHIGRKVSYISMAAELPKSKNASPEEVNEDFDIA